VEELVPAVTVVVMIRAQRRVTGEGSRKALAPDIE